MEEAPTAASRRCSVRLTRVVVPGVRISMHADLRCERSRYYRIDVMAAPFVDAA
jgi:hypothetical protein